MTFLLAISAWALGQNGDHDKMMENKMMPHQKEMDRNFHHPRFISSNNGMMNRPSMVGSYHQSKLKNAKKPSMPYNHKPSMNKPVHKLQSMMGKKMMSAPKMGVKPMKMVVKMPSKPMMMKMY